MQNCFAQKVVWITGASSGIGEALAYAFSEQGARLILSSRHEGELNRVKDNCAGNAGDVFVLPMDITEIPEIEPKTVTAMNHWGGVDYVIHNAGIAARGLVTETCMNVYRKVMETNYFGTVGLTQAVLPFMLRAGKGHFVVVSSIAARLGVPQLSAYGASKLALHAFFDSLRAEIAAKGITVTLAVAGFVNTQIVQHAMNGQGNYPGKDIAAQTDGLPPEVCAARIIRAVRKNKTEVLIGRPEVWGVYIRKMSPKFFGWLIRHHPMRMLSRFLPRVFKR